MRLRTTDSLKASCCNNQIVSFAHFCIDTSVCCISSKLWPHGRTVECWSEGAGMCCVGYQVAHCSGVSNWSPTSNTMLPHYVGVFATYSSACRAIYLFATFSSEGIQEGKQKKNKKTRLLSKLVWSRARKVAWSGKQSLTWHYLQEEPAISSKPLRREW